MDETKWVVSLTLDSVYEGSSQQDCTDRDLFVVIQRMMAEPFEKITIEPVANYA